MQQLFLIGLCGFLMFASACSKRMLPIDGKATTETQNLYNNLYRLSQKGIMFGHQDDLAYGIGWKYQAGRSDVKAVAGDYPAVVGWDLGHLELRRPVNLDSVPFDAMRSFVQQVYQQGGLNTFSWHPNNPLDLSKDTWAPQDSTIRQLLQDGAKMKVYTGFLDELAAFFLSLKGSDGTLIPVIFRPLHEHTGSWFWWGRNHSSVEEYKQFWRFTVDYLRKEKGVHNLLYAYSPDRFADRADYLERYPGDEYVDILGFDIYHRPEPNQPDGFVADTRKMVETLAQIGKEKNKVIALSETGLEKIPEPEWWTKTLLPVVQDAGLAYVLVWRNGRPDHYYAPYPGQASAEDFKKFYQLPYTLFLEDVAAENLYQAAPKAQQ